MVRLVCRATDMRSSQRDVGHLFGVTPKLARGIARQCVTRHDGESARRQVTEETGSARVLVSDQRAKRQRALDERRALLRLKQEARAGNQFLRTS